ncbi:MAG: hypothetical protein KKB37_13565 [Alphaproteobacteria bacterium]|nr:hypothetical protein [Alphaproteobacteria bacterium]
MINLRRLPAVLRSDAPEHQVYRKAWLANSDAPELRILEIAELAYILEADGFPEPEIFRRVGAIFPPAHQLERHTLVGDPVRAHAFGHLSIHASAYIKLGVGLLNSALALAELWAIRSADCLRDSRWPPEEMLGTEWCWVASGLGKTHDAADTNAALDVTHNGDALATLNDLMQRAPFPANPEVRRLRARAVPGDRLLHYSTGAESFRFAMGSAGIALVRNGRAIDFMETTMN